MSRRWGRGWEVGVRKAIDEHERDLRRAGAILEGECGTRHALGTRADLCPKCQDFERRKESDPPMTPHEHTLRGPGPDAGAESEEARTRTLRGLGILRTTLRGLGEPAAVAAPSCPACAVKHEQVSVDLAICYGLALVFVQGADPAQQKLCEVHRRLLRLLVDELKVGPKRVGDTWDD